MKVLIIEDEVFAAQRLSKMLEEIDPSIDIFGPIDTISSSVQHLIDRPHYDLIFLDIQLADGKSFSIFEQIQLTIPVIFTTAFDEFALKAFEVNSVDYLLKPLNRDKLKIAIDKFKKLTNYYSADNPNEKLYAMINSLRLPLSNGYKDRFLINQGSSMIFVKTDNIYGFYAEGKVVFLITAENTRYIITESINDLENKLNPKQFFRVNRHFLISIDAIKKVHNYFNYKLKVELKLDLKQDIIVSRARVQEFKVWMNGEALNRQ